MKVYVDYYDSVFYPRFWYIVQNQSYHFNSAKYLHRSGKWADWTGEEGRYETLESAISTAFALGYEPCIRMGRDTISNRPTVYIAKTLPFSAICHPAFWYICRNDKPINSHYDPPSQYLLRNGIWGHSTGGDGPDNGRCPTRQEAVATALKYGYMPCYSRVVTPEDKRPEVLKPEPQEPEVYLIVVLL